MYLSWALSYSHLSWLGDVQSSLSAEIALYREISLRSDESTGEAAERSLSVDDEAK